MMILAGKPPYTIIPSERELVMLSNAKRVKLNKDCVMEVQCSSCWDWLVYSSDNFYIAKKRNGSNRMSKQCISCNRDYFKDYSITRVLRSMGEWE